MKDTKYLVIDLQLYYSNVIVCTCTPFTSVYHCNEVDRYEKEEAGTGEHLITLIIK